MKVAVIGSGIAGLASSIRLRSMGLEVSVFETNSYPGGKLTNIELEEFRFDAGPSLFTMPQYVEELFEIAGKDTSDYFEYEKVKVNCHYFYPDGTFVKAYSDQRKLSKEFSDKFDVSSKVIEDYFKESQITYEEAGRIFLEKSLHKYDTWLSGDVLKALIKISKYDINRSLNNVNKSKLKHPKLVQLFNRYATYNGSNPYVTPGIMKTIPHLEHGIGTFLPKGGMHAIATSLYELAQDIGVEFKFNTPVEEIVLENGKLSGIKSKSEIHAFDLVVSNMDVYHTYQKLLPQLETPKQIVKQERSSSALIFYWGINREFPELDLHNIFFSEDYKQEFDFIFNQKQISTDPTVYVNITSKYNKTDAPKGSENWFVMINAPYNENQNWSEMTLKVRSSVIEKLSQALKVNLEDHIVIEDTLDPIKIEARTQSYRGSLYGTSSNDKLAAFLRHPNFKSSTEGLYFCGGSVHPGGGIPLCLLSAKIVGDLVSKKYKKQLAA
ncbi:MAG: 1-hydroxycarotenoid 3,4-desaturase CrtD [Bacteroidota bacterium]